MLGNVWEWVEDEQNLRGGGWHVYPTHTRASYRGWDAPGTRSIGLDFRCAVDFSL